MRRYLLIVKNAGTSELANKRAAANEAEVQGLWQAGAWQIRPGSIRGKCPVPMHQSLAGMGVGQNCLIQG